MQHSVKMATMRKSEWKKNVWKCFMVTLKGSYYFFLLFWALWVFAISRAAGEKTACSREPRVRIQHAAEDSACFFTRRSGRWAAGARQHQEAKLHTRNKNTLSTVTVTLTPRERSNFRRHKHGDVFICSFIFLDDFTLLLQNSSTRRDWTGSVATRDNKLPYRNTPTGHLFLAACMVTSF